MIPKIIHQTYRDHNLPTEIKKITDNLKIKNPDWVYKFYTDSDIEDYIYQNFDSKIVQAYNSIKPVYGAARADLFRYLVLYNEGGVYLDIKSTCEYPLSNVIDVFKDTFIVSQWQNEKGQVNEGAGLYDLLTKKLSITHGEFQQWFIVSEKKSPILKKVIDDVVKNILNYRIWKFGINCYGKKGVIFLTGPVAYTKSIEEVKNIYPIRRIRYDSELGFKYNALKNKNHSQVLKNHYSKYKKNIVKQGLLLDFISFIYIIFVRIFKNIFWKA